MMIPEAFAIVLAPNDNKRSTYLPSFVLQYGQILTHSYSYLCAYILTDVFHLRFDIYSIVLTFFIFFLPFPF